MLNLTTLRQEYLNATLDDSDVHSDPLKQFSIWFSQAQAAKVVEPNAMTLATVNEQGQPSARIVLIKDIRPDGFVWFTNYKSRKGLELTHNEHAALLFFWQPLERQVRIEGIVKRLDAIESDVYYNSRPLNSRLGAWSSPQSQIISSRTELEQNLQFHTKQFANTPPRPEHWGGYILQPTYFEFWQGRASRLHDRMAYQLHQGTWEVMRLAP